MLFTTDNITYLLNSDLQSVTVTKSLAPYCGDISIPATVVNNGVEYAVTDILDEAFAGCTELTSVVIGDNVESLGISSFEGCTQLSDISFGKGVHII